MKASLIINLLLMRKLYWIVSLVLITLSLFFLQVLPSLATDGGLELTAPESCPPTGCASGQRLNFSVKFLVSPNKSGNNTQVCIYAPTEGRADEGDNPWASTESGWISLEGMVTGQPYQPDQLDNLCKDHMDADDEWLKGAYADLKSGPKDQLEFALNIHKDAEIDGYIKVKVLEAEAGNNSWNQTASYLAPIAVAERTDTAYVARTADDCGPFTPCFINSADDLKDGIGTGLRDAVMALDEGDEIRILKDYAIKSHGVLVDKRLFIRGHDKSMITYSGSQCTNPMLILTDGATLSNLTINDGNCIFPSRNLIEVDSASDVVIKQNTLTFGKNAVEVYDNNGNVTIAFNQITNNDNYAIFRKGGDNTGKVNVYANNIINNRVGYQVHCNNRGIANHNFWGQSHSATNNAAACTVSNAKQLGAAILLTTDNPGVQAQQLTVSTKMNYVFNGKIGASRSTGEDFDIIIVNHGQGALSNIPFFQTGPAQIQPCSNFYDVFLAHDAAADDLILAFKYDLNANCVAKVESQAYCGGTDSKNFPLWWYDPGTNVTDGWDRTGQNPQGPGAGGASGQETTCHLDLKEIRVNIDNTGRPNISSDLNFTPFVVGLPIIDGITLSEFTAQFDGSKVNLRWITSSETSVKGFYLLRGETETGTYTRISNLINAIGDTHIGGTYQYTDQSIIFTKAYYYKIEVIDKNNHSIATYGPVSILTATATPTATPTRTPTAIPTTTNTPITNPTATNTRTPFPVVYRTPTPFFRPRTATPSGGPTPIRTFMPSPTGSIIAYPITEETPDPGFSSPDPGFPSPDPGYPIEWEETPPVDAYPPEVPDPTPSPTPIPDLDELDPVTPEPGGIEDEDELPAQNFQWLFIIVGGAVGLGVIGAISVILVRSRFS